MRLGELRITDKINQLKFVVPLLNSLKFFFFIHRIEAKQQIMYILEKISLLQPPERLLLYLRMPSSTSETGK